MEAYGVDGDIIANNTHLTISWKSLRGRLSNSNGSQLEIVAFSDILDLTVVPATHLRKGCFQLHLPHNSTTLTTEINWMSNLHQGILTHGVMFAQPSQFQFNALAAHVISNINVLKIQHNSLESFRNKTIN